MSEESRLVEDDTEPQRLSSLPTAPSPLHLGPTRFILYALLRPPLLGVFLAFGAGSGALYLASWSLVNFSFLPEYTFRGGMIFMCYEVSGTVPGVSHASSHSFPTKVL